MRVDERWRPLDTSFCDEAPDEGTEEPEDEEGVIDTKGERDAFELGGEEVLGDAGAGGIENDAVGEVGLDEVLLLDATILTVACDNLGFEFNDNCEEGREVTLNAGGGDLSRISVGTMGVGSVRS